MQLPPRSLIGFRSCFNNYFSWLVKPPRNGGHVVVSQRHIHISNIKNSMTVWESNRKGTEFKTEDKRTNREHIKRGAKMLIPETQKWLQEMKEYFQGDVPYYFYPQEGVVDKFFDFNGPESLDKWCVSSDSDWEYGFSTANISISPSGSGIFSGNLCTRVPKTGLSTGAGFVNLKFIPPRRSFQREHTYQFVAYTHLALRVRGDGRTYMVNLHPHNYYDMMWLDLHSYVLHTRGGPYWQETYIPFSKFFLHHKGRIHDDQYALELDNIKTFSITLMDQNDGPFNLEIDYVGCISDQNHDDTFVYEQYYVPRFSGKN